MAPSPLVEVRLPTFNRPGLLRRALGSLLAQSYSNWRAIVLDDGCTGPTAALLDELRDPRLVHRPNRERLGAARNIGQSFSSIRLIGGTHFGVLEDDNYWYPTFLARNLKVMADHDVSVVQSNQHVEAAAPGDAQGKILGATTLGECHAEGRWRLEQFKLPLLWRLPISNSGLFWRADARTDFRADDIHDALLQEWVRGFRIADDVYFISEPLGVWRANDGESQRTAAGSRTGPWRGFLERERAIQAMRRDLYALVARTSELSDILSDRFPASMSVREEGLRRALVRWPGRSGLSRRRRLELFAKAWLLRLAVRPSAARMVMSHTTSQASR
jgi:glycosyltransferase involved in cell wall biosynthesis